MWPDTEEFLEAEKEINITSYATTVPLLILWILLLVRIIR